MFGATTTVSALLANVTSVTSDIFPDLLPYIIVAVSIPLTFVLGRYVISLFKHGFGKTR